MTNPTPLSQAAHAVLDAFVSNAGEGHRHQSAAVAAALRAAADKVVPEEKTEGKMFPWQHERLEQRLITRDRILAIAAELEGAK